MEPERRKQIFKQVEIRLQKANIKQKFAKKKPGKYKKRAPGVLPNALLGGNRTRNGDTTQFTKSSRSQQSQEDQAAVPMSDNHRNLLTTREQLDTFYAKMHDYVEEKVDEQKKEMQRTSEVVIKRQLATGVTKIFQESNLKKKSSKLTVLDNNATKKPSFSNIVIENGLSEEEDEEAIEQKAKNERLLAISKKFSIKSLVKQEDRKVQKM